MTCRWYATSAPTPHTTATERKRIKKIASPCSRLMNPPPSLPLPYPTPPPARSPTRRYRYPARHRPLRMRFIFCVGRDPRNIYNRNCNSHAESCEISGTINDGRDTTILLLDRKWRNRVAFFFFLAMTDCPQRHTHVNLPKILSV